MLDLGQRFKILAGRLYYLQPLLELSVVTFACPDLVDDQVDLVSEAAVGELLLFYNPL